MFDNFPLGRFRQFLLHLSRRGNVGATEIDTGDVLIGLVLEDQGLAKSSIGKPTNCAIVQLTKKGFLSLEKAQQTCAQWAQTYPREFVPHGFLSGFIYPVLGRYE